MEDNRTMAQLLEAPTVGYEDAIIVPEITADNFELKHGWLTLILTWDDLVFKFINKFFPPSKTTNLRNEITRFQQRFDETFYEAWDRFNDLLRACPHHGFSELHQLDTFYNALKSNDQDLLNSAAGGLGTLPSQNRGTNFNQNHGNNFYQGQVYQPPTSQPPVYQAQPYQAPAQQVQGVSKTDFENYVKANDVVLRNMQNQGQGITTRSGVAYKGPTIPTTFSKVVERETEVTKDTMHPTNNGSTKDVQPLVVPVVHHESISKPVIAPVSASMPNQKTSIPFPSRRNDERRHEKANNQIEKFYEIFRDLSFEIIFTDALMLMPKFASTLKALIGNKEKLSEMARTPLNENCSAILSQTPRVPLILGRSFLKTSRALIDIYEGEITLRIGREAITFNLDQTLRYTANYNHMTANRIDVIDMAYKEYSQEVLGFSNVISSGNPTPYYDLIVSTSSPTLTPFGDSDFLLFEEADSFLAVEDDPTSPEVDPTYYDPEGDIILLEAILNSNNKLPVIIAKDLKNEEKAALIEVLKSHKRAIAWKLSDIKGIDPEFCTHKILMEEDYKPTVQHQRRVNPKIHDIIKKEVEKLLDVGLIYPISDSPWVSPVHCVPKKGGMTIVKNDENDLIPTRLVTGWRLSRVHSMLHVSNLKKCLSEETLAIPLDEIQIDDKLHFIEEPVEIMDHEVKCPKQSRIPIVKVRWNSKRGPEFT
ncbi:reverse transcriptase domain-containing protein [Tanacetum coccineum]